MTPKEKAISLVKSMSISDSTHLNRNQYAKQCALIAVDELLNEYNTPIYPKGTYYGNKYLFWMEVKQEIEKL
jgi:hypothetical protein